MRIQLDRRGRAVVPVIVLLLMLTLIFLSVINWRRTKQADEQLLLVSGTVEARYTRIASQLGGRITELPVEEGMDVKQGQLIVRTDPLDLPMQLEQASRAIETAQANLDLLREGPTREELAAALHRAEAAQSAYENIQQGSRTEDIAAAEAAVAQAQTRLNDARDELGRLELLFKSAVVEERKVVAARAQVSQLEDALSSAKTRVELLRNGPREEEIEQARQQAEAARSDYERLKLGAREQEITAAESSIAGLYAGRDALQVRLDETNVSSPADGEIINLPVNIGDMLQPGQTVAELLLPDSIYIQTFIPEDRLAWISLGSQLEYFTDGVSGSELATVSFITPEAEFTPRNLQTTQKRVEQVYRVKLQPASGSVLRPGLICDVRIPAPEDGDGSDG